MIFFVYSSFFAAKGAFRRFFTGAERQFRCRRRMEQMGCLEASNR